MIEKLSYKFDIDKIVEECYHIKETVGFCSLTNQISLKHTARVDSDNIWYEGCGSLIDLLPGKTHKDFTMINKELTGTYIESIIDTLQQDYSIGRARIMRLEPRKCMSLHVDLSKRIHIPVVTNTDALMIINNEIFHMPADGSAYLTDTTKRHTALNASKTNERLHLLFDLV